MSRARKEPVQLDAEFELSDLPTEMQRAVTFANAHDRRVLLGYIEDEKKVYLMTVENDEA